MFLLKWLTIIWLSGSVFWGVIFFGMWFVALAYDWRWHLYGEAPKWVLGFAMEHEKEFGVPFKTTKIQESEDQVWFRTEPIVPLGVRRYVNEKGEECSTYTEGGSTSSVPKDKHILFDMLGLLVMLLMYSWITPFKLPYSVC